MIIKDGKVFIPINGLDKLQTIAGILVENGFTVERAKVKVGKSYKQGILVSGDGDIKALEEEDE
jgi:hypothetical protein